MHGFGTRWSFFGVPDAGKQEPTSHLPVHNRINERLREVRVFRAQAASGPGAPGGGPAPPVRPVQVPLEPPESGTELGR